MVLLALLQGQGRHGVHANAVDGGYGGILIVGGPGRGKTTLTVCLVNQGWQYVADDAIALHQDADGHVEALAVRRSLSCGPVTMDQFPQLQSVTSRDACQVDGKFLLDLEAAYPGQSSLRCHPRLIIFPEIGPGPHSELLPMDRVAATLALLSQMSMVRGNRVLLDDQLKILRRLLDQTTCFRLKAGGDVLYDGSSVAMLLTESLLDVSAP